MEGLAGAKPPSARARRIARSREEMLGLLADFSGGRGESDSDRELSFSDLVEAVCRPDAGGHASTTDPPAAQKDGGGMEAAEQRQQQEEAPPLKQQQQQLAAAPRERRLRRRPSDSRGSCGGGGDGVLLNFYVPGLLTRSMTTSRRPCRRTVPPAAAVQSAPPTVAAGKARTMQAPLAVGCWPALWGRCRDRRSVSKRGRSVLVLQHDISTVGFTLPDSDGAVGRSPPTAANVRSTGASILKLSRTLDLTPLEILSTE